MASSSTAFSPTAAVRGSSRRWMDGDTDGTKSSVSIDRGALGAFAREIANSILSNRSLEVAEWDSDGWHYTGRAYVEKMRKKRQLGGRAEEEGGGDGGRCELMRMERVALYVMALDAINFCFWPLSSEVMGQQSDDTKRSNGLEYEHLAVALRKIAEEDHDDDDDDDVGEVASTPIIRASASYALNPPNLAALTPGKFLSMLQPHLPPSSSSSKDVDSSTLTVYELPYIDVRCQLLNELGNGLLEHHSGSVLHMISKANCSADALAGIILDTFPGFRDYVNIKEVTRVAEDTPIVRSSSQCMMPVPDGQLTWEEAKSSSSMIHFYKRAQIAIADLWAALGRNNSLDNGCTGLHACCHFKDMNAVTTFPDYRVPQILRHVDVMQYESRLAALVDAKAELPKGGNDEVSIRAATVVAVEEIVEKVKEEISKTCAGENSRSESDLQRLVDDVSAVTIDWYLWQKGEKLDRKNELGAHHRVCTTFY